MRVAINKCYGGFSLSDEAIKECIKRGMTCHNILTEPDVEGTDFSYHPPKEDYPPDKAQYAWDCFGIRYFISERDDMRIRTHPTVLAVIEEMGAEANGQCAEIEIVEINDPGIGPDDIRIEEYDGMEWIAENHRTWG